MSSIRILIGDCRDVMQTLPECSVDAIVCDPPYDLTAGKKGGTGVASVNLTTPYGRARIGTGNGAGGFMGQKWDGTGVAFDPETWRQALRVLKPGGMLVAFGGTRTYHRMACAIEDAGFEIRDQLAWLFASGFPKSLNLDNERGKKICGCDSTPERDLRPVPGEDVSAAVNAGDERGQVLQQGVPQQGSPAAGRSQLSGAEDGFGQSCLEGWRDDAASARELRAGALHQGAAVGAANGQEGRLCDGAPTGDGGMVRLPVDADGSGASRRPQADGERARELGTVAGQPQPQVSGAWPVCSGCGLPVLPRGYGTALKPAHEPICLARKPLEKGLTVAANVLKWGTGALNIDGCRVAGENTSRTNHAEMGYHGGNLAAEYQTGSDAGRWPANLITSYPSEEYCLRDDVTPGQLEELAGWLRANA